MTVTYSSWNIMCIKTHCLFICKYNIHQRNFWGISCEKSRIYAKKIIFFPILGSAPEYDITKFFGCFFFDSLNSLKIHPRLFTPEMDYSDKGK